jgi:8-oxo-dGTP pyrophosphatase MutT (NUDIX family)
MARAHSERKTARRLQYGALPYRVLDGRPEILLITSRETGRWVVPKGWPMKRRSPTQTAAQEALEEAGVRGEISRDPIGSYSYVKRLRPDHALGCAVVVFPLRVCEMKPHWREQHQRVRAWFELGQAALHVDEPELQDLIRAFAP